jgi:hypothetical protein
MKNVTLSAEEYLIESAREVARAQNTTLNQAFREWLETYTKPVSAVDRYEALMHRIHESGVMAGRTFTREEMNER